jgi:hypothetical protein
MKLQPRTEERAVSELLGGIFLFALLLAVVVLAQVALVPTLNQQVEYEHSLRAQGDLQDLQSAVSRSVNTGGAETVPIEMGVTYPSRFLLLNPPPAAGELRTGDALADGVVLEHVAVPDAPDTDEYWRALAEHPYESRILGFAVDYNEFGSASEAVIEGAVMFQRHDAADVVSSRSALVDGRQINLVVLAGDLATSRTDELAVDVRAVSGPARTITVTDDGTPISVSVRTLLSQSAWVDRLGDEPYVDAIGYDDPDGDAATANTLTVTLRPDVTYSLRMGKVAVGGGVPREDVAYLTRPVDQTAVVPATGGDLVSEVRDAFNNPVAGENVTYEFTGIDGQATLSWGGESIDDVGQSLLVRSDADGRAAPRLTGTASDVEVTATVEADGTAGTADYETVTFEVQIGSGSNDDDEDDGDGNAGDGDEINPNNPGSLVLVDALLNCAGNSQSNCDSADVEFENRGTAKTIDEVRANFYQANDPGGSPTDFPATMVVDATSPDSFEIRGGYVDVDDIALAVGDQFTWQVSFEDYGGGTFDIQNGNAFVITILFDDGSRSTYFVAPR